MYFACSFHLPATPINFIACCLLSMKLCVLDLYHERPTSNYAVIGQEAIPQGGCPISLSSHMQYVALDNTSAYQ